MNQLTERQRRFINAYKNGCCHRYRARQSAISNAAVAAQKPYQVTAQVACTTFACPLNFPPLNAPVVLKHVSCQLVGITNNTSFVINASLNAANKSGTDTEYLPVNDQGSLPFNDGELYFLNAASYLFGDSGSHFFVTVETQLTLQPMVCTISGDYID
jgi:hypothetical protein